MEVFVLLHFSRTEHSVLQMILGFEVGILGSEAVCAFKAQLYFCPPELGCSHAISAEFDFFWGSAIPTLRPCNMQKSPCKIFRGLEQRNSGEFVPNYSLSPAALNPYGV